MGLRRVLFFPASETGASGPRVGSITISSTVSAAGADVRVEGSRGRLRLAIWRP
jgi:hypothetical protein